MPIPKNELFESFLSATKLVRTKPKEPSVAFTAGQASVCEASLLYLNYPEMELKLDSVLKRIALGLNEIGCSADPEIALATLGILVETRDPATSSVAHANHCLSLIHSAQLYNFVVLPNRIQPNYEIQIDEFWLRAFDPTKLLYWANRGRCGYPIDLKQFSGCIALERAPFETKLINWNDLPGCAQMVKKWEMQEITASIMDV